MVSRSYADIAAEELRRQRARLGLPDPEEAKALAALLALDERAKRAALAQRLQAEAPVILPGEQRGERFRQFRESTPGMTPLEAAGFLGQVALAPFSIPVTAAGSEVGRATGLPGGALAGEVIAGLPFAAVSSTVRGAGAAVAPRAAAGALGAGRRGALLAGQAVPGGAETAAEVAASLTGPAVDAAKLPLELAGRGVAAAGRAVPAVARGAGQYAEDIGKANIGNALMPPSPSPRTAGRVASPEPPEVPKATGRAAEARVEAEELARYIATLKPEEQEFILGRIAEGTAPMTPKARIEALADEPSFGGTGQEGIPSAATRAQAQAAKPKVRTPEQQRLHDIQFGTESVKLDLVESYSDPMSMREMVSQGEAPQGFVEGGDGFIYKVEGNKATLVPGLRADYNFDTRAFEITRKQRPPSLFETPIFHRTNVQVGLKDLKPGIQYGRSGANSFNAIYFETSPAGPFGKNVVEARISPTARVVNIRDTANKSTKELLDEGVDVVVAGEKDGEFGEVIVLNPRVLTGPAQGAPQRAQAQAGTSGGTNLATTSQVPAQAAQAPVIPPSIKEPHSMTADEFFAELDRVKQAEAGLEESLFGVEGAKKYARAQRTANSSNASAERYAAADKIINEMEASLTEAQRNSLYGQGETGRSYEALNQFRVAFEGAGGEDTAELIRQIGSNLYKVNPKAAGVLTDAEQIAAIKVRNAVAELTKRGMSQEDIFQQAGRSLSGQVEPADAEFLLKDWLALKNRQGASPGAPTTARRALPAAQGVPPQAVTQAPLAPPPAPPPPAPPVQPPVPPAGAVPPVPPEDALVKATRVLQSAKPLRIETAVLRSQEAGRRVGTGMAAARGLGPLEQERAFTRTLSGQMPIAEIKLAEQITTDDITTLSGRLIEARDRGVLRPFEWKNASEGFRKTFGLDETFQPTLAPRLPQDHEIALMERVFGPEFAESIIKLKQSGPSRFGQVMAEVIGAPKTLLSGPDLSAPLRQGLLLIPSHPVVSGRQFARSLKSFVSERNFIRYQSQMKGDTDFHTLVTDGKLFWADPYAASAKLTSREEAYISRLIQRLPELKQLGPLRHAFKPVAAAYKGSERAYIGYLNGVRYEVAKQSLTEMRNAGVKLSDQAISLRMAALNHMTGRGTLGKNQNVLTALNAPFWSPGLQLSRFQVLGDYGRSLATIGKDEAARIAVLKKFKVDPAVRVASNQTARELTAFVAMGAAIVTLIKLAIESKQPGFENMTIEADPRSTDFGKIKQGNTRIEFWGGFQPWARFLTQLTLRQEKDVNTGKVKEALGKDIAAKFFRTKLSPGAPALTGTALFGYTYEGGKTELTAKQLAEARAGKRDTPLEVWEKELLDQFISLTAQQITEIYRESPRQAAATIPLSVLGTSVSTYGPPTKGAAPATNPWTR